MAAFRGRYRCVRHRKAAGVLPLFIVCVGGGERGGQRLAPRDLYIYNTNIWNVFLFIIVHVALRHSHKIPKRQDIRIVKKEGSFTPPLNWVVQRAASDVCPLYIYMSLTALYCIYIMHSVYMCVCVCLVFTRRIDYSVRENERERETMTYLYCLIMEMS